MKYILYALLIWFLYNLIFKFVIPLYRTTSQVKKKFREMKEQMDAQRPKQEGFTNSSAQTVTPKASSQKPSGDYIDFEEVK